MSGASVALKLVVMTCLVCQFAYIAQNILEYEKHGMEVIMQLQAHRSRPLDVLMRVGSFFGFEFFFFLVPLLAWWGDKRYQKVGVNLFIFLLAIFFMVSVLKVFFSRPRPMMVNTEISQAASNHLEKIEFSFPSGHAWGAMSFFFLAKSFQKTMLWVVAFCMASFTVFSRVYFGVHYPHDTLAGMICGVFLILAFTFVEQFLENLFFSTFESKAEVNRIKAFFADKSNTISVALLVLTLSTTFFLEEERRQRQQGLIFVPFCFLGIILSRPFFIEMQCDSLKYRMLRLLTGVPLILSLHFMYLFAPQFARPLIATMVGIMIFGVAPHVFLKLNLAQSSNKKKKQS